MDVFEGPIKLQVIAGDIHGVISSALDIHCEDNVHEHVLLIIVGVIGASKLSNTPADQWYETQPVSYELVIEDGGVDFDLDQIDGQGWDLRKHDPTQGIGNAWIRIAENELAEVWAEFANFYLRIPFRSC